MGDTGSLLIGLVNAILVIRFINSAASPTGSFPIVTSPALGFAILVVPLFDTLRVFAIRMLRRRSPFSPDRNHIHHLLMDYGCSHARITYLCLGLNVFIALVVFLLKDYWNTTVLILAQILLMLVITGYLWVNRKRKPVLYSIDSKVRNLDEDVIGS
jgi:UDP-N-acetylmuramyl pentapeptide phosphotransferase/UDP-N-acetylglucosamine-1-phosphate transferase